MRGKILSVLFATLLIAASGAAPAFPDTDSGTDRTPIGGNVRVSGATAVDDELYTAIAHNSTNGQYLVVWRDDRNSGPRGWDIYGQRMSATGVRLGSNFRISGAAATGNEDTPAVAYNSTANQYLVVWEDDRDGTRGWDIWGQRLSATGARLGSNFRISGIGATDDERTADVVYNPGADQYMVVWMDHRDGATRGYDVWGRRVAANGARVGANFRISRAAATGNETLPSIACNTTNGQYLVAWEDDRDAATRGSDIRGQRLSSAGARLGPNILVSSPFATDNEKGPAAAYNPAANQYRVVWVDDRDMTTRGWDIRGQRLSATGGRLGPNLRVSGDAATANEYFPAMVFNTTVNRYLVVWSDGRGSSTRGMDIWGQQLYSTGGRFGSNFRLSGGAATNDEYGPSVATSSGSDQYFVAWEDDRNFITRVWDVWGQLGEM